MNKKMRFTGKADSYAKGRPHYSDKLIEYIMNVVGVQSGSVVGDVGAGTGIFSKQLLEKGCRVICVEPNNSVIYCSRI